MTLSFCARSITPLTFVLALILFAKTAAGDSPPSLPPTQRQLVQEAMKHRPQDPWPRGAGHALLAWPGSREDNKAYHEPGGSFSPAAGSLGISFWEMNSQGEVLETSDSLPMEQIRQHFVWNESSPIPVIQTETPHYRVCWAYAGPGKWVADFRSEDSPESGPMAVLRSVGPAGGPVWKLEVSGQQLLINERWQLEVSPRPLAIILGEEGTQGWKNQPSTLSRWEGASGWGFARLEFRAGQEYRITLIDTAPVSDSPLEFATAVSGLELDLPDPRFAASLNAQVAHLMMGLVGRQTRPGETTNYPLAWLRDGTYSLVALTRSGQLETAKALAVYFAENDFFGGFGPEADAPGLAIWALEQVAIRTRSDEFDRWLWPHVYRKVGWIEKMLNAKQTIYHQPVFGPLVPSMYRDSELALLCDAARDGLMVGKMDHHRPILFVNAVSYQGLLSAAKLAERLGMTTLAGQWRLRARDLQCAWIKGFRTPEADNDRTYISGLWPSGVAANDVAAFRKGLLGRWEKMRTDDGGFRKIPLWTYFDFAEAHQWLFLGEPSRTWKTLNWYWDRQASPGLYTWWEGNGEENGFNLWDQVRGWVNPPHVTPHYWTAAESLLLQLDMLGYQEETSGIPTLIIGAGIPPAWLSKSIRVGGLSMDVGHVDWEWKDGTVTVTIMGPSCEVKLGPAFPAGTKVQVLQWRSL